MLATHGLSLQLCLRTDIKSQQGDTWVAQQLSACLRPRARSWSPGINSHIGLPAWSLFLSLPMSLPLCVCVCLS